MSRTLGIIILIILAAASAVFSTLSLSLSFKVSESKNTIAAVRKKKKYIIRSIISATISALLLSAIAIISWAFPVKPEETVISETTSEPSESSSSLPAKVISVDTAEEISSEAPESSSMEPRDIWSMAKKGDSSAQAAMGDYYFENVPSHPEKSFEYYTLSADQGNVEGICGLGKCYYTGFGVEQNYQTAFEYFSTASDMTKDNYSGEACYYLGLMYEYGDFVDADIFEATNYYQESANLNNKFAQYKLARIYEKGNSVIEIDYELSLEYLRKSSENGYSLAKDLLGWKYEYGDYVERDIKKAIAYYEEAAAAGSSYSSYKLGYFYFFGTEEIPINYPLAYDYLTKSIDTDNPYICTTFSSYYILGKMYEEGYYVDANAEKAMELQLKGAENGDLVAQYMVGVYYLYGTGTPVDKSKWIEWLKISADNGYYLAQYWMGEEYLSGENVKYNLKKAKEYLEKSAAQGCDDAQIELNNLENS